MSKISDTRLRHVSPPATPVVHAATVKRLKSLFAAAVKTGKLEFRPGPAPVGASYVRVPLKVGRGQNAAVYTALLPTHAAAPGARKADPNSVTTFFVERKVGRAGTTAVAGPISLDKKGPGVTPFFGRYLEDQEPGTEGTGPRAETRRYPSDQEDLGEISRPNIQTKRFPSDQEDSGEISRPSIQTKRFPSDQEDLGASQVGGGRAVTQRYPSDNEDGSGTAVQGRKSVTLKNPSDGDE